jgi:alkylated DNA repair dioxygenase AlkB
MILGVDPARGGKDKTGLIDRHGRRLGANVKECIDSDDLMHITGIVVRPQRTFGRASFCQFDSYISSMATTQPIQRSHRGFPEGFQYNDAVLSLDQEQTLVEEFAYLPFREFEFRGFLGKRRTVSFGWRYDFNVRELQEAKEIPTFLLGLRETVAKFAGLPADRLQHALVTEYSPGAAIGWHKDRPEFNDVIGISLLAPCVFRLRRKIEQRWERASLVLPPRSAYLLRGVARDDWQHSIPPVDKLRYSVTFRSLRESKG